MRGPPVLLGAAFLSLFLLHSADGGLRAAPAKPPSPAAPVAEEESTEKEKIDEVEVFRQDQRKRLAEGVEWAKLGVFIPLVVAFIVALVLFITPKELFTIRPFDKNRDRKRQVETPEDTGYKDSDFHW